MKKKWITLFSLIFFLFSFSAWGKAKKKIIWEGSEVTFDYVLTVDGQASEPLRQVYQHGSGRVLPAVEAKLEGLSIGDEKTIVVPPEEGFGAIKPEAFREIKKEALPDNVTIQAGQMIMLSDQEGKKYPASIFQVREDTVILNLNHPLAGKELQFDIKIVSIK